MGDASIAGNRLTGKDAGVKPVLNVIRNIQGCLQSEEGNRGRQERVKRSTLLSAMRKTVTAEYTAEQKILPRVCAGTPAWTDAEMDESP